MKYIYNSFISQKYKSVYSAEFESLKCIIPIEFKQIYVEFHTN